MRYQHDMIDAKGFFDVLTHDRHHGNACKNLYAYLFNHYKTLWIN